MSKSEFCRTCFGTTNLMPIFNGLGDEEQFTNDLFTATGVKIEKDDTLPQVMCTECNNVISKSVNFRKKCEETNTRLLKLLDDKKQRVGIEIDGDILLEKLDTDKYLQMEGTFNEFIVKAKSVIFTNEEKKKKSNSSFSVGKVKVENEPMQCQHCPKVFTTTRSFVGHQRVHNTVKAICQYCGAALKDEQALLVHHKARHGHARTDAGRYCDYRGTRPERVKIHERTHTGEKPYVCEECGAGFHRKSSYLTHTPLHLPDKTVPCSECSAMFKSATLMRIHASSAHRRPRPAKRAMYGCNKLIKYSQQVTHLLFSQLKPKLASYTILITPASMPRKHSLT